MYSENSAPEALATLPAQKEVVHHKYAHLEPVMASYSQDRVSNPITPSSSQPSSTQNGYPHTTGLLPTSSHSSDTEKPVAERPICGLTQRNFMILFIVALFVVGASIGGGVGGGLAARKDVGPNAPSISVSVTPSASSTSSSPAASSSSPSLAQLPVKLDCPGIDGTTEKYDKKWTFEYKCGKDITGSEYDIVYLASYLLEDCVRACTSYNKNRNSNECTAVEFNAGE
ncbi:hypothetical protein PG984_015250 [Apiospora sp. TS-2023a]